MRSVTRNRATIDYKESFSFLRDSKASEPRVRAQKLLPARRRDSLSLKADLDGTTFAYDCRMRFLERALLASCKKKAHNSRHCLYL